MTPTLTENRISNLFRKSSTIGDLQALFKNDALKNVLNAIVDTFKPETVSLTGGALVALDLDRITGTFYGTTTAPATTGALSVSSVTKTSAGKAIVYYQAASAPTLTGITDVDVASGWDNTNVNIIEVTNLPEGVVIARLLGDVA